jgi:hypothetical protein
MVVTLTDRFVRFCVLLKLPTQSSGEQDVQKIYSTRQSDHYPVQFFRSCVGDKQIAKNGP